MKFKYRVKLNGVTYPAGADVPVEVVTSEEKKPLVREEEKAEVKPTPKVKASKKK